MELTVNNFQLPIRELVSSVLLIVLLSLVRIGLERYLRSKNAILSNQKRRILSNTRNAVVFLIIVGLILIWTPALRTFALSITAFLVAIVIATKELILCISGGVLRTYSGAVRVGDWVEVGGIHGELVHQDMFSMHIQEIPSDGRSYDFTGRTIVVPNSVLLTTPIKNENFFRKYVYHQFQLVFDADIDFRLVEDAVLTVMNEQLAEHADLAQRYNARIESKAGVDLRDIAPQAIVESTPEGRVRMRFTAFVPTRLSADIEQRAIRQGLDVIQTCKKNNQAQKDREDSPK